MVSIEYQHKNRIVYSVKDQVRSEDLKNLFKQINPAYEKWGKLRLLARVESFQGYTGVRAILTLLRYEPSLIWKAERYAIVTDQSLLRYAFNLMSILPINTKVRTYTSTDFTLAYDWIMNME